MELSNATPVVFIDLRGGHMTRAEEYRRYAADCLRIAQASSNPNDKRMMLEMAQRWRELAEKAERQDAAGEGT